MSGLLTRTGDSNIHLSVRARRCGVDYCQDRLQIRSDSGPVSREDDDDCDVATGQVLLILEALISANEDVELDLLHCGDERAILEQRPSAFIGGYDIVPDQELPERAGRTLIEKNLHLRGRQRTLCGMLQHEADLLRCDALEPLGKVLDRGATF